MTDSLRTYMEFAIETVFMCTFGRRAQSRWPETLERLTQARFVRFMNAADRVMSLINRPKAQ